MMSPSPYAEPRIVVDLRRLLFVTPTYLLRRRAFIEWHCEELRTVEVHAPSKQAVSNYMARMHVSRGLPGTATIHGLPHIRERNQQRVLIPITKLRQAADVDRFVEDLGPLLNSHSDDAAALTAPIEMAMSELCGNAVDHGFNPVGCLVAAQRYRQTARIEIAIGDLGIGIPRHMRRRHKNLGGDREVIATAMQDGVTGTKNDKRGNGFYWVVDEAKVANLSFARLEVRSGRGRVSRSLSGSGRITTRTMDALNKSGTWITYELGPPQ